MCLAKAFERALQGRMTVFRLATDLAWGVDLHLVWASLKPCRLDAQTSGIDGSSVHRREVLEIERAWDEVVDLLLLMGN